jgi:hypothetical protein
VPREQRTLNGGKACAALDSLSRSPVRPENDGEIRFILGCREK